LERQLAARAAAACRFNRTKARSGSAGEVAQGLEELRQRRVRQSEVDEGSHASLGQQSSASENPKLLRDIGLTQAQAPLEVADAGLLLGEDLGDLQANGVGEST
jgi:hypothetical protein